MLRLIKNAENHRNRVAVRSNDQDYSFATLLSDSINVASCLLDGRKDLKEERIAFLVSPGYDYVRLQWGIWRAGGIAVPLCTKHPFSSINYVINDTQASTIICSKEYEGLLSPFKDSSIRFLKIDEIEGTVDKLPDVDSGRRAMILYTSGTTGQPKGVVSTHQNIEAQIESLVVSWEWSQDDHILNILPLHHVHGIINILSCAMWSGACCEFLPKFDASKVFEVFIKGEVNLFMAVPTIYYKLISYYESCDKAEKERITSALKKFRLMVSGSAALPISVLEKWKSISGHILLERYGMTEMGMAISNPYQGERRPGHIGKPLSGIQIRIANESDEKVPPGEKGEIQVKGPNVFKEYWEKPEATQKTFTKDGWLKTGDMAVLAEGYYRILGRNSVDIIKSGGYKISALEIEEVLRTYPNVKDCGVVGVPDEEWGEVVAASLILLNSEKKIDISELKSWLKAKLPSYQIPKRYIFQEDLPRNVMGKVTKKSLVKIFQES